MILFLAPVRCKSYYLIHRVIPDHLLKVVTLTVKQVIKVRHTHLSSATSLLDMFFPGASSSPKSPKFNELRARYEAVQKAENELKSESPPKFKKT